MLGIEKPDQEGTASVDDWVVFMIRTIRIIIVVMIIESIIYAREKGAGQEGTASADLLFLVYDKIRIICWYSDVGLGSSLRGEPGLTNFRSQGCPWKIISGLRQSNKNRGVPGSGAYDKKNHQIALKVSKNLPSF